MCFKSKYVGQICIAICWDDAEGHFRTNDVCFTWVCLQDIKQKHKHTRAMSAIFNWNDPYSVSAWNFIQMRVIQPVTSGISALLPVTGLPFRTALTYTITESANTHTCTSFGSCNTFLSLTMANTIWSISQGLTKKKKKKKKSCVVVREAPFSWAHLNITLHITADIIRQPHSPHPIRLPLWAPVPPWLAGSPTLVVMVMALLCRGLSEWRVVFGRDPEWLQIPLAQQASTTTVTEGTELFAVRRWEECS